MDVRAILSYAVTVLGFLLCCFSILFVLTGKRIAGDRGEPQILKYKDLEFRTNSVLTLLIISAIVAVLPLGFLSFRPVTVPSQIIAPAEQERSIYISGYVFDESQHALDQAKVSLFSVAEDGKEEKVSERLVGSDGAFDFSQPLDDKHRLKLVTQKTGYRNQTLIMGVRDVTYPPLLVKEGH